MNIAHKIKQVRINNNMTQFEFSGILFVSCQIVSNWERGVTTPSLDVLLHISHKFNIPIDFFLKDDAIDQLNIKKEVLRNALEVIKKHHNLSVQGLIGYSNLREADIKLFCDDDNELNFL